MTPPPTPSAAARLTTPGEIVAVLPWLCGFPPSESLVVLSLRGPRQRLGLTLRLDLPPAVDEEAAAVLCAMRMAADGATHAVVVVCSEGGRRTALVEAVGAACARSRVGVAEALHVAGGRWSSYRCTGPCCPPAGTPVPLETPVLDLVRAERAAAGRAVLGSRAELVRAVAPPTPEQAGQAAQLLEAATAEEERHRAERGAAAARRRTVAHATALLDTVSEGDPVEAAAAIRLAVGLGDVRARDEVATLMLRRADELLSVLLQTVRQVTGPGDAPACALLAWVAYARGDGALANVALDRALSSAPAYSLARLLRQCLDDAVPPEEIRGIVRATSTALQRRPRGGRSR